MCQVEKYPRFFYKNWMAKDKLRDQCKECCKESSRISQEKKKDYYKEQRKKYYEKNRERILADARERPKSKKYKSKVRENGKKYRAKYPEKARARSVVSYAIRMGRLVKQPCSICGSASNVEAHHMDYSKPLDVAWLCREHHRKLHSAINMYFKF